MDAAARAESDTPRSCRLPADLTPGATAPLSLLVGAHMALLAVLRLMGLGGWRHQSHRRRERPRHRRPPDAGPRLPAPSPVACAGQNPPSHRATVAGLLALLGPDAAPLAWNPFQIASRYRRCGYGYNEERSGRPEQADCPQCGGALLGRTHLELDRASPDTPLHALGIAPREILAVRKSAGIQYILFAPIES